VAMSPRGVAMGTLFGLTMIMKRTLKVCVAVLAVGVLVVAGSASPAVADDGATSLSLRAPSAQNGGGEAETGYTLSGPYYLRSADPEETGEMEFKFIYSYGHEADEEEEHEFEFEFEWGIAENWEFIFEVPFIVGNGEVEGNGDATLGLHTRLWNEDGWIPAFAVRNMFRIPTGYHGQDWDYTLRGLFTWTLNDAWRLHFNPYLATNNDADDGDRNFLYGGAIGFDWRYSDDLILIADYQYRRSMEKEDDENHVIELGADWEFADDQMLGFGLTFGVEGDDGCEDFGISLSYILEIPAS